MNEENAACESRVEISAAVAVYNEERILPELCRRLAAVLKTVAGRYEIVLVDDGSKDGSWKKIEEICGDDPNVRGIKFSRNFGQHVAITAALDNARGDYVVLMDADLQDRPEEIPKMLERCKQGFEVVYARRRSRADSAGKKLSSRIFYSVFNKLSSFQIRPDVGVFRIITRRVCNHVVQMREQARFIPGLIDWMGFSSDYVDVDRPEREAGETQYTLSKLMKLGVETIIAFSNLPLRLATGIGFIVTLLSFPPGIYLILKWLFLGDAATGWACLIAGMLFLGGVQLLAIGIVGEYIGRIYMDVKQRPLYVVEKRT